MPYLRNKNQHRFL